MKFIKRDELQKLIKTNQGYKLIDVREKWEHKYGIIPTSNSIPFSEFDRAIEMLEKNPKQFWNKYGFSFDKKDRVILYCRSGGRSFIATQYLISKGYHAENYAGSILDWAKIDDNIEEY